MTAIRYELTALDWRAHEYVLRMYLPEPRSEGQLLTLPAWIPGSYMIRDFARNVTALTAADARGAVAVSKLDKQTWRVGPCTGTLVVDYRVYAFDLSVRSAYLDQTRAYFNGTCLFLRPAEDTGFNWEFQLARPDDPLMTDWRVATTLPAAQVDAHGFGVYAGEGYDRLIDCPVEIGAFEHAAFRVDGVPHELAVSDGGRFDMQRLTEDLTKVCAQHAAMFGELPVTRYLFLTLATADGYGGLEHCDSTSLICRRAELPAAGTGSPNKDYRRLLALCSHEYFHLWNVKRIRPQRLIESDLSAEAYTELLWAFEGITSYYDELALARSGVLSPSDYLDLFANSVTRVLRVPGHARQSIAESSFDAWTKFYKQDENAPNAIASYYTKGALVAFGLDVTLRERSGDALCLDDLMRRLWQRYGRTAVGVPERAIEAEAAELLGTPLDDFFARYVYGTEELPLSDWFGGCGIGYRVRATHGPEDLGGYQVEPASQEAAPALGARFEAQAVGLRLTHVITGGAAQVAGLAPGDLLLAVDGERVTGSNLADLLRRAAGAPVEVHLFRRDRLLVATLADCRAALDTCELWLLPDEATDARVRGRRAAWLGTARAGR